MGTFIGHIVPGSIFIIFGLWWTANIFFRFFYSKVRKTQYKNTTSFPCPCSRNAPQESYVKILFAAIGIIGETYTGRNENGHYNWGNGQHISMYLFFGINALIELLYHAKWDLPPKLDYVTGILAYGVEGFLFYHHLHGRSHLDVMIHMFLFYAIVCCALSLLLECSKETNVIPALLRSYFTILQGTWFYQIAFILFSPSGTKWNPESHDSMMIVTITFTWHMAVLLLVMAIIGAVLKFYVTKNHSIIQDKLCSPKLVEFAEDETQSLTVEDI